MESRMGPGNEVIGAGILNLILESNFIQYFKSHSRTSIHTRGSDGGPRVVGDLPQDLVLPVLLCYHQEDVVRRITGTAI